jgi:hypothetical protein
MEFYSLLQTIVGFLGLISIILLFWEIRSNSKWNKIQFSINRLDKTILSENIKEIKKFGINMDEKKLSEKDYKIITDEQNVKCLYNIQAILNMFEDFSILYNMNVLNNHFAYQAYSENAIFYYTKFKRIIEYCREQYSDSEYYIHFEKCANKFIKTNLFEK